MEARETYGVAVALLLCGVCQRRIPEQRLLQPASILVFCVDEFRINRVSCLSPFKVLLPPFYYNFPVFRQYAFYLLSDFSLDSVYLAKRKQIGIKIVDSIAVLSLDMYVYGVVLPAVEEKTRIPRI